MSLTPSSAAELFFATPPLGYYAPVPEFHDRMARSIGIVASYVVGPSFAEAIIFGLDESEYHLVVGGDFHIENRMLRCEEAPSPDHPVSSLRCPDWPSEIVLDETPVIFTYWRARVGDDQIAVLRRIDRLASGEAGAKEPCDSGDPEAPGRMPECLW